MEKVYDIVIVGGGPAGLTAAIYAGRANLDVLVIEKKDVGSLVIAHSIENYPGFPEGITGKDLYELKKKHAGKYGTEFVEGTFLELDVFSEPRVVKTDVANYRAKSVILASGWPKNNESKILGEAEFVGRGVSYCATCDGAFTRNLSVGLFGQGEEVAEEALFLTKFSKEIVIFTPTGGLNCNDSTMSALKEHENVKFVENAIPLEITGSNYVEEVMVAVDNKRESYKLDYAFMYLGTKNSEELYGGIADIDMNGYLVTGEDMSTNIEGIYAAGDIRSKQIRQVTTAVSDGTIASMEATKYLLKKKGKKGRDIQWG